MMRLTGIEERVKDIITPVLDDMGIDLLWVEFKGGILSIFAENPKTGKLTLNECAAISLEISPLLEVEDPISTSYRLEVSSAGIDRPLLKLEDYTKYHDLEVKIELDMPVDGQKKFRGFLRGVEDETILLETDQGTVDLPYSSIYKAKLVMTDTLIKETKKRFELANENNPEQEILETTN
ncbi:MAG TPA: ribosome maturation factor RimP [Alphaproteobacteria bacterium]|nr:ribosome maturation factor RimP [Alphaproteobacteria bacterium]